MEKFKAYIVDELGLDESDVSDQALMELYKALGTINIEKLYSKEYRLLSEDNFLDYYGVYNDILVRVFDCKYWFSIVMYENRENRYENH